MVIKKLKTVISDSQSFKDNQFLFILMHQMFYRVGYIR